MDSENCDLEAGESPAVHCDLFKRTKWGKEFTGEEIEEFAAYLAIRRDIAGNVVFREGDKESNMYFLVDGKVIIVKEGADLKRKLLAEIGTGMIFGELSLVDQWPRSATAVVEDNAVLLVLTKDKFDLLLRDSPQLGVKILQKISVLISHRLRRTSGILVENLDA